MRQTLAIVVTVLFSFASLSAQTARKYSFIGFFQGIELKKVGNSFDYMKDEQALVSYTVVNVPAGVMEVKFMYEMTSDDNIAVYLATVGIVKTIEVRDGSGKTKPREASVSIMFTCGAKLGMSTCREKLQRLMKDGFEMQSLGVVNDEDPSSDILPETNLIFGFLVRESGKFN